MSTDPDHRARAAIVGTAEYAPLRHYHGPLQSTLDQWTDLAALALADAGIPADRVDGLVCATDVYEATHLVPALLAEHCGWKVSFAERVDLGGASAVGMVWRAAMAIEAGVCTTVVCALPARPRPPVPEGGVDVSSDYARSDLAWGSPVARYEAPYGNLGPNVSYALAASAYDHEVRDAATARAHLVADQRLSASVTPGAVHFGKPVTAQEVATSRMIVPPIRLLEIVMPCAGGAAVVVSRTDAASTDRRRVVVSGFGEASSFNTPTYSHDLLDLPLRGAVERAYVRAGTTARSMHMAQLYDPYAIAVLLSLESAGFCRRGEGAAYVMDQGIGLSSRLPCNTNGGQLGFGQAYAAGGMTHVIEAVRQIQGLAGERQLVRNDRALVSGSGGNMSVQGALVLEGE